MSPLKIDNALVYNRALSSPRSDASREVSPESPRSAFQLIEPPSPISPSSFQTRQIITVPPETKHARPTSAHSTRSRTNIVNRPEHLVYGNRSTKDINWVISSKPVEHRMPVLRYSRADSHDLMQNSLPAHIRSKSAEASHQHYVTTQQGRASRYIRRANSPHRNTIARVRHEDDVIRAIQMGLDKRQRAIRVSHYQMPDPTDYEWEI